MELDEETNPTNLITPINPIAIEKNIIKIADDLKEKCKTADIVYTSL